MPKRFLHWAVLKESLREREIKSRRPISMVRMRRKKRRKRCVRISSKCNNGYGRFAGGPRLTRRDPVEKPSKKMKERKKNRMRWRMKKRETPRCLSTVMLLWLTASPLVGAQQAPSPVQPRARDMPVPAPAPPEAVPAPAPPEADPSPPPKAE